MSKLKKAAKKTVVKNIKKAAPQKKAKAAVKPKSVAKKAVAKKAAPKKTAVKAAKALVKKTVKPVAKKAVKKAAKPVAKKVAKPVAKKVAKPIAKKIIKPIAKKAAKPVTNKVAKPEAKKVTVKPIAKTNSKTVVKPLSKPVVPPSKPKPIAEPKKGKEAPIKVVKPSIEIMQKNELPKLSTIQTTHSFTKQKVQPAPSKTRELNADGTEKLRYNDKDLEEFRVLIVDKIANAKAEFQLLQQQLNNANDNGTDDTSGTFKMLEDGSETLAKEEAAQLAARQRKFIEQLENALIRIKNKTFGICRVTGKLIPKDRLRAVPHTTQSIEAKLLQNRD